MLSCPARGSVRVASYGKCPSLRRYVQVLHQRCAWLCHGFRHLSRTAATILTAMARRGCPGKPSWPLCVAPTQLKPRRALLRTQAIFFCLLFIMAFCLIVVVIIMQIFQDPALTAPQSLQVLHSSEVTRAVEV